MKLEDVPIDGEVIIGGKMVALIALFGVKAKVVRKSEPMDDNEVYPFGMVQLELPANVTWPSRVVYIGPEDLAFVPGWSK